MVTEPVRGYFSFKDLTVNRKCAVHMYASNEEGMIDGGKMNMEMQWG